MTLGRLALVNLLTDRGGWQEREGERERCSGVAVLLDEIAGCGKHWQS